jgi:outer membrane protein TolC
VGLWGLWTLPAQAQIKLNPELIKSLVKEHALGVKAVTLAKERTVLPETAALSRYDNQLNAGANYLFNEADSFSSPSEGRSSVLSVNGGVARTLRQGTQLQLGVDASHSDFNARGSQAPASSPFGDKNGYTFAWVAGVSQPLLRNAWGETDWLRVERARKLKLTTDLQIEETAEKLIELGLGLYYRALAAQAEIAESQMVYKRLTELLRTTQRKVQFNLQMPGEIPTLKAETLTWSRRLAQGEETLEVLKVQLRNLLRLKQDESIIFGELALPKTLQMATSTQKARALSLQANRVAIAQDDLEIARSEAKADLSVNLQLKSTGVEKGFADTTVEWLDFSRPTLVMGVKWQAPASTDRFDAERYDKAVALKQEELEKQRLDEQLRADLDVAQRNVETSFRLAQETEAIVKLWEKGAKEQEQGYAQGRVSLVEVIRTLNALSQAKLERLRYVSQYHLNQIALAQLSDQLY